MKKRKKHNLLIPIVLGLLLGLLALRFEESYIVQCAIQGRQLELYTVTLVSALAALLLHTIVHELGHLIFGLLTGYRFSSFRIGGLILLSENGKLVLRRHSIPGTAGQCLMAPPELLDGKIPVVLYTLGGCIANLIVSGLFFWMMTACPVSSVWSFVLAMFAVVGLLSALLNGIPGVSGTVANDGHNTWCLLRDQEAVRAVWLQLEISHRQNQGEKILDMPAEWFAMPTGEQMQNSLIAFRAVLHTDRLSAEGKVEEADALMAALIAGENAITPIHRALLRMQRLWLELIRENRPEVVKELQTEDLKWLMKAMKRYPPVIRMEYALAILQDRDERRAEKCLRRFEKVARHFAFRHQIEDERKCLEVVREKAKKTA